MMVLPQHHRTKAHEFSRRMTTCLTVSLASCTKIRKLMHNPKTKVSLMYRSGNLTRLHGSTQLLYGHSAFVFLGLSRHCSLYVTIQSSIKASKLISLGVLTFGNMLRPLFLPSS